jgi:hypothetical protein
MRYGNIGAPACTARPGVWPLICTFLAQRPGSPWWQLCVWRPHLRAEALRGVTVAGEPRPPEEVAPNEGGLREALEEALGIREEIPIWQSKSCLMRPARQHLHALDYGAVEAMRGIAGPM